MSSVDWAGTVEVEQAVPLSGGVLEISSVQDPGPICRRDAPTGREVLGTSSRTICSTTEVHSHCTSVDCNAQGMDHATPSVTLFPLLLWHCCYTEYRMTPDCTILNINPPPPPSIAQSIWHHKIFAPVMSSHYRKWWMNVCESREFSVLPQFGWVPQGGLPSTMLCPNKSSWCFVSELFWHSDVKSHLAVNWT